MSILWNDIFPVVESLKKRAMSYAARGEAWKIPATGVIFSRSGDSTAVQYLYLSETIDGTSGLTRFCAMIKAVATQTKAEAAGFMVVMPSILYTGDESKILAEIEAVGGFHNHPLAQYNLFIHMEHGREGFQQWVADTNKTGIGDYLESGPISYSEFPTLLPGEPLVADVGQA